MEKESLHWKLNTTILPLHYYLHLLDADADEQRMDIPEINSGGSPVWFSSIGCIENVYALPFIPVF